jgi:hypothetical protein
MKIKVKYHIDSRSLIFYASFVLSDTSKLLNGNAEFLKSSTKGEYIHDRTYPLGTFP